MRPHGKKPLSEKRTKARVRGLLRETTVWVRGYPIGVEEGAVLWRVVPQPGEGRVAHDVRIDRSFLRKATFRRSKLIREFPRMLPAVVGDVSAWRASFDATLDRLKACVHGGEPLPRFDERLALLRAPRPLAARLDVLRAQATELADVIEGLAWLASDRRELERLAAAAEGLIHRLPDATTVVGERGVTMLVSLAAVDGTSSHALSEILGDPTVDGIVDAGAFVRQTHAADVLSARFAYQKATGDLPPLPGASPDVRAAAAPLLDVVYPEKATTRRRMHAFLNAVWPKGQAL